jgi:hypothetical protein
MASPAVFFEGEREGENDRGKPPTGAVVGLLSSVAKGVDKL